MRALRESKMDALTIHDLLFRNTHLIIDKPMLLNRIAQSHQLPTELFESLC